MTNRNSNQTTHARTLPLAQPHPSPHLRDRARRLALALAILVLGFAPLPAQQTLADADWFVRQLGDGVVWKHYLFDDLFGSKQAISYVDADLSNPNVSVTFPYLAAARQKTSVMVPAQFPASVAGANGTYFDTTTGGHRTYLRVGGTVIPPGSDLFSPWGYEGALALDASDNASIEGIPAGGWANDATHPDIFACGPLVIVDGDVPSVYLNAIGAHCTARHPRTAVGITPANHLILLVVDGRTDMSGGMTCVELGETLKQLGCADALNLDGGGSSTLWGAGELFNGVLNFPSDNGVFDHEGERSCSNAIAVQSIAAAPVQWDARLTVKNFLPLVPTGTQQTVTLAYENIGTVTWTAADTKLVLSRPTARTSVFYHAATWPAPTQPALMTPATVAPGETATFTITFQAPVVAASMVYDENFMLTQAGVGRIGPADSEAWMRIIVQAPVAPGEDFIVESRLGGQNYGWYSDSGMANTSVNCSATSCTASIGSRYGSTYRSVAGAKRATVAPDFPAAGDYKVYVAWGAGSLRRSPITYHVNHADGSDTFQLDQTATADEWIQLGTDPYHFDQGTSGSVVMTNENVDVSGSMYAAAVKFEYQAPIPPDKTYVVRYLEALAPKPVIDGQIAAGEWADASPAGTGYVAHNNPLLPAAEDGSFQMLHDATYLYILFRMNNAYLPGFATPPTPYGFHDLDGDQFDFFFTPQGISADPFYRVMFCANPTDGVCYVWSQASLVRTTDALTGTDWIAGGNVAHTYAAGTLTIEYRIPWSRFDYPGMSIAASPEGGDVWGVQPTISNEVSAGAWEYVNWEPDDTPSYIYGNPLGGLVFENAGSSVCGWGLY